MKKICLLLVAITMSISGYTQSVFPKSKQKEIKEEWKLVWQDEFEYNGLPDNKKWDYEVGFIRNNEQQFYTVKRLENVLVNDGFLTITGRKENFANPLFEGALSRNELDLKYPAHKNKPLSSWPVWITQKYDSLVEYTSASIVTKNKASWKYGRIEVRAKLPNGQGVWPAIWLLGNNIDTVHWPKCGEIDIMEFLGKTPDKIYGTVHYSDTTTGKHIGLGEKPNVKNLLNDFHVYSTEWDSSQIAISVDNKQYLTFSLDKVGKTNNNAFRKHFYLILNLALGGDWPGSIDDKILPQSFIIDYVRVYKKNSF